MASVRRLSESGIADFREYLERIGDGAVEAPPTDLLIGEESSLSLQSHAEVEPVVFTSKQAAAEYLKERLAGLDRSEVDHNAGLWSWLSLFYFDQVCPPAADGKRKPGEVERHIPSQHAWKYYRHLLAGPYRILGLHHGCARAFLHGALHKHGDFSEQLASRMELISNRNLIEAVDRLYVAARPDGAAPKVGATTRTKPGNLRRLIAVIQQFDLTYDLYAMPAGEILALLPAEFERWRGR